jgi:PAS domain S-box-containing protein
VKRRDQILADMIDRLRSGVDQFFFWVLLGQWLFAIGLAIAISPYTYTGDVASIHFHVKVAVVFGGMVNTVPIAMIYFRPGWWLTRHVVAVTQMIWTAIMIMITNGRIETHFHIFGSVALLALYRDWKILTTATFVVAGDHLIRGLTWPGSVYGISNPEWWVFLEHAGWVLFMDIALAVAIVRATREMARSASREARLERVNASIESTVEKRTRELQESSERYRALVENTQAVTFEYDIVSARMTYIAPQAARLLGCSLEQLENREFLIASIHPEDRQPVWAQFLARAAGARAWEDPIDCRLVTSSGSTVYVRTFFSSVGASRRVRAVALDVTRQHALESELHSAQKLESVGRLAAGVAHEINTPIQFVGDSVSFMKDSVEDLLGVVAIQRAVVDAVLEATPNNQIARAARDAADKADVDYIIEEMPNAADRALDGVARVSTIVRSMKAFAHPDGAEMTTVDLVAAIHSTLTISRNEYRYTADLVTEIAELPPVTCFAGEVNQALLNIIVNAAHAMADVNQKTGARGTLTVSARATGDHVEIEIRDTGGGIPDTIRDRVFDPFFTTKEVGRGTGQGLAIARSVIVDRHKGSLRFDSTPGVGTTFHIRLPIDGGGVDARAAA